MPDFQSDFHFALQKIASQFAEKLPLPNQLINIHVDGPDGQDTKPFQVQRAILTNVSQYFSAFSTWDFCSEEDQEQNCYYPLENENEILYIFFHWLLKRNVDFPAVSKVAVDGDDQEGAELAVQCVIFGEKYGIYDFQTPALKALELEHDGRVSANLVQLV
jgi:hypothetical protein